MDDWNRTRALANNYEIGDERLATATKNIFLGEILGTLDTTTPRTVQITVEPSFEIYFSKRGIPTIPRNTSLLDANRLEKPADATPGVARKDGPERATNASSDMTTIPDKTRLEKDASLDISIPPPEKPADATPDISIPPPEKPTDATHDIFIPPPEKPADVTPDVARKNGPETNDMPAEDEFPLTILKDRDHEVMKAKLWDCLVHARNKTLFKEARDHYDYVEAENLLAICHCDTDVKC